jgi:reductive dehalogenase
MLFWFIVLSDLVFLGMGLVLVKESIHEQEKRATWMGALFSTIGLVLLALIIWVPVVRMPFAGLCGLGVICGILFCIPGPQNAKALKGAIGYLVGTMERLDESFSVFVRTRGLRDGSREYKTFYEANPELEEPDKERRNKGLLGKVGKIDAGYQPNVAMVHAAFEMDDFLGKYAVSNPVENTPQANLDPEKASHIVKNFAKHLGAEMVGICELNPAWIYAKRGEIHYGNWEDWGKELNDLPKYAVVFLVEMEREHVMSAPHTPSVVESAVNYAVGTHISTVLGRWFAHMGYRGSAENARNYDVILPPLAADAGLGEVGRHGYLIAPKFGARVRVFATLTDMPLIPDKPISLGVEEFCEKCMKCADSCPSRSIPTGPKTVCRGFEKWKLDDDSCFEYWARVGTDCSICMAICPYSRPNSYFHKFIRWFVAHAPVAKAVFPHIDNFIYGKRWKARKVPDWLSYPKRSEAEDYPTTFNDIHY